MITIIRWWRIKAKQIKIKLAFYNAVEYVLDNYKELIPMGKKLFDIVKNSSPEDLQSELIGALAEIIHNEAKDNTEEE